MLAAGHEFDFFLFHDVIGFCFQSSAKARNFAFPQCHPNFCHRVDGGKFAQRVYENRFPTQVGELLGRSGLLAFVLSARHRRHARAKTSRGDDHYYLHGGL